MDTVHYSNEQHPYVVISIYTINIHLPDVKSLYFPQVCEFVVINTHLTSSMKMNFDILSASAQSSADYDDIYY